MRRATSELCHRLLRVSVWGGALLVVGLTLLLGGGDRRDISPAANNVVNLQISDPGGAATGVPLNLSSYAAAANSLVNGNVKLEWPGAQGLGVKTLSNASVTFNGPSQSITLLGTMSVDAGSFSTMVIFDWEGTEPMPVISLGIKGNLDMTKFNAAWKLEGGAFTINGFAAISTGEQDLTAIPAAAAFYGDRGSLGAQLVIEGSMSINNLLPGIGANAGLQVDLGGEFDVDIESLIGAEEAEPSEPGAVSLHGTIAASNLSIPAVSGLTATSFTVTLDLAGENVGTDADFAIAVEGEVTLNNAAISSAPVTFDVAFRRDGTGTVLEGGLKDGVTWTNPFGVAGVEVNSLRLKLDAPPSGTPTLTIIGTAVVGGVGVEASIKANDELAVDFKVSAMTVKNVISLFGSFGFNVGSLSSINNEIGNIIIGPTTLHLETEAGALTGAVSTSIGFRGKTATFLLAGGTSPSAGVLAAVQLPAFTIKDLWTTAPASIAAIGLPDGGIVISSHAIAKATFEPGGIEDDFLSEMYCGAATAPAACAYNVPSGLTVAAQMTLDPGIRESLAMLGPMANTPVRVEGTLPIFGTGDMSLKLTLPKIVPSAGSASAEWLKEARLSIEMKVTTGNLAVKLQGAMDTQLPDDTAPTKFDNVTFSVDAEISIGTKGIGITIGAEVGTWNTPFGIDWLDLNGFRLEVVIKVAPQPGIQVGLAASATLKSPCQYFGGSCPPPSTFNASFAISVAAGAPVQVDFGFRMFADAINLRDVAAIARKMGAVGIDPSSLPNASLRNVEFAFSTIDAPSVCLTRGLTIGANLYLDSPMSSGGPGAAVDRKLCSDSSITPAEGIASCQSDSNCFAHMRLKVSSDGIIASAALGTIDLNPVTISGASASLIMTTSQQEFTLAGQVSIAGLGSAQGSVKITSTGFEFSVTVADEDPGGNLFTIQGSAGLNAGEPGVFFNLRIFVRLPGLNTAIDGVQNAINELKVAFGGEPLGTLFHLRCVEANVNLMFGASDPISGSLSVKVHFVAEHQTAPVYYQGKVWQLGWNFDASLASNVTGLLGSLSGNTSVDDIGCGYMPTTTRMNTGFNTGISTQATASYDTPTTISAAWVSTDYAAYSVTLDMADGLPERVVSQGQFGVNSVISIFGTTTYRRGAAGYDRRTAVAQVHIGGPTGPVVGTVSLPILVGSIYPSGYSLTTPAPVSEGGTLSMTATWTDPVPTGTTGRMRSEYTYTIYSLSNTSGTQVQAATANGSIVTYPTGSTRTHTFSLPVPARCGCQIDVTHVLKNAAGQILAAENKLVIVNAAKPVVTNVTIDGSGADPANGGFFSVATISFTDPRGISGTYEVWLNNLPMVTTAGPPGVLSIPLSGYYQSGAYVPFSFQVRSASDGSYHRSNPFQQDVVFRSSNSDFNLPQFVQLPAGQKAPHVLAGSTVSPTAADDGALNPFGSADCGAIWYYYSPGSSKTVRLTTDGSSTFAPRAGGVTTQELAIAVYKDGVLLMQIAPDGNRNVTSYPQLLTFDVTVGSNYYIAVSASDMPVGCAQDLTVSGPVVLTFTPLNPAPLQDTVLGSLQQVPGVSQYILQEGGINPLTNPDSETELDYAVGTAYDGWTVGVPGFAACFDDPLEQTVWYLMTPSNFTAGVPLDFMAISSGDVQVAVFKDTNSGLQLEGCNEEAPAAQFAGSTDPLPPVVGFTPTAGASYYLMVDTHGRQNAKIEIYVMGQSSSYLNPTPLTLGAPNMLLDNSHSNAFFGADDLSCSTKTLAYNTWFLWTAPSGEPVDIASPTGNLDIALAAFLANDDPLDSEVGCQDRAGTYPETLRLNPTAGQTYLILAASEVSEGGAFEMSVSPRGDYAVNEVSNLLEFPYRVVVNNASATSDGKSATCTGVDGASLHFGFNLPPEIADGLDLDIDTIGSAIDTRLVVSGVGGEIGCNDDIDLSSSPQILTSRVRVDDVLPGGGSGGFADLYLDVDGFNNTTGDITIDVTTRGDDIGNAVQLVGVPAAVTLNTVYATVQADEQRGGCAYLGDSLGHTVWVKWTAPTSRYYTATALGFDSQVTVFESVNGLPGEIVGCGEDDVALAASARFPAPAGATYLIQVDGYASITGNAAITIADDGFIDGDGDAIDDNVDNCLGVSNPSQADSDGDLKGDACDPEAAFASIVPARLVDTRSSGVTIDGQFQKSGARIAGSVYEVQIGNRGGVPANAVAAILNVTTVSPAGNGFATVFPCGVTQPTTSSINFAAGRVDANEIVAKLDGTGKVCIYVSRATHVLVDAVGYVTPTSPYVAITPDRYADTRAGAAIVTLDGQYKSAGLRTANSTYEVQIAGRGAVPVGAAAVVMNLTVTGSTAGGFATVFPCGTKPDASSANWTTGLTRPNELIVKLSPTGSICVFVSAPTHLILDVVGYLPPTEGYTPITPARLTDTRVGKTTIDGLQVGDGVRPNGNIYQVQVAGRGGVPLTATSAAINVSVIAASNGYLTVYPCGTLPTASSLNFATGNVRPNELVAKLSPEGRVCVFVSGSAHLLVDVVGYS